MPKRFLLQILRSLVTQGILKSTRGVVGGYVLARPTDEITLLEILEAIDGPIKMDLPGVGCGQSGASERLVSAREDVRQALAGVTLADLVRDNGVPGVTSLAGELLEASGPVSMHPACAL